MNPEKKTFNNEVNQPDLEKLTHEGEVQKEKLNEKLEREANKEKTSPEKLEKIARYEALEHAQERKEVANSESRDTSPAERRRMPSKADREVAYNSTMKEVRSQMSAPSRAFSKVIHNKVIEKVSDVTGNTIARPNAVLSGAVFAFILTLAVYLIAKNLGYPLSGFETIGAFVLGWIVGLVYDFLKTMITGRSN